MAKELLIKGFNCVALLGKELATYTPWSMAIKINQKEFVSSSKRCRSSFGVSGPEGVLGRLEVY